MAKDLAGSVLEAVKAQKSEWEALVAIGESVVDGEVDAIAVAKEIAKHSQKSEDSVLRRLRVIVYLLESGLDPGQLLVLGSPKAAALHREYTRPSPEQRVRMAFVVPETLKEAFLLQLDRLAEEAGILDREGQFDAVTSILSGLNRETLLHLLGREVPK